LGRGEKIKISGFGNFVLRDKRQRPGRNPQTGDPIKISERRVLTFKASQILKQALNPKKAAGATNGNGASNVTPSQPPTTAAAAGASSSSSSSGGSSSSSPANGGGGGGVGSAGVAAEAKEP
jgi:integration host factor subunit alpha